MKIRGMRWGCDNGGFACGPVEGNTNVELMVMDEKGHQYFVLDSKCMDFNKIQVFEFSAFDLLMGLNMEGTDFEYEIQKMDKAALETYDFEEGYKPEKMSESKFYEAIEFVEKVMKDYYGRKDDTITAEKYIEKYLD